MRKFVFILNLFFLPLFSFGQTGKETGKQDQIELTADLGVGQEFFFRSNTVKFLKVISDSRCPRQVTCIWPGEAKVLVGIELNGNYFEKEIVVSGGVTEFWLTNDLLMQVSHLRPYPETAKGIPLEQYCLRFTAVL